MSNTKLDTKTKTSKWCDIIGHDNAKEILFQMVILPTLIPEFFTNKLLCTNCLILLYGVPGTGKSKLVESIVYEYNKHHNYNKNISLIRIIPSLLLSKYTGEAEKKLKSLFDDSIRLSPSIIFIDELDAFAINRLNNDNVNNNRSLLSELLMQMTRIKNIINKHIIIICCTNTKDDLDPAIIRRFTRLIEINKPTIYERYQILKYYLDDINNNIQDDELYQLSELYLDNYTGSNIENLCRNVCYTSITNFFVKQIQIILIILIVKNIFNNQ